MEADDTKDSVDAYGSNKHPVTDVESDALKKDDYEIEQRGSKPSGLKKPGPKA